jgi:hypothetical protein
MAEVPTAVVPPRPEIAAGARIGPMTEYEPGEHSELGNLSTLAEPAVVEVLIAAHREMGVTLAPALSRKSPEPSPPRMTGRAGPG